MKKMMFIQWCLIVVFGVLAVCGCKENEPQKKKTGEYLYIDQYNCIHAERSCYELRFFSSETNPNYMVDRIETSKLLNFDKYKTCSYCVDDDMYKEITNSIEEFDNDGSYWDDYIVEDDETLNN